MSDIQYTDKTAICLTHKMSCIIMVIHSCMVTICMCKLIISYMYRNVQEFIILHSLLHSICTQTKELEYSLEWPNPFLTQGVYHWQCKHWARHGHICHVSMQFTEFSSRSKITSSICYYQLLLLPLVDLRNIGNNLASCYMCLFFCQQISVWLSETFITSTVVTTSVLAAANMCLLLSGALGSKKLILAKYYASTKFHQYHHGK